MTSKLIGVTEHGDMVYGLSDEGVRVATLDDPDRAYEEAARRGGELVDQILSIPEIAEAHAAIGQPTPLHTAVTQIATAFARQSAADRDVFARAWLEATGVPVEEAVMEERCEFNGTNWVRRVTIRRKDQ